MENTTVVADVYSPAGEAWRMFRRNKAAVLGLILFNCVLQISFIGPYYYEVDPFKIVRAPLTPPGQNWKTCCPVQPN